jgi:hypothetical protein
MRILSKNHVFFFIFVYIRNMPSSSASISIDMNELFLAPFAAASEAQLAMSMANLKFVSKNGLDNCGNLIIVSMGGKYEASGGIIKDISLNIPLIMLLNTPSLVIDKVTMDFTMVIQSQASTSDVQGTASNSLGAALNVSNGSLGIGLAKTRTLGIISSETSAGTAATYVVHMEASHMLSPGMAMLFDTLNGYQGTLRPFSTGQALKLNEIFT